MNTSPSNVFMTEDECRALAIVAFEETNDANKKLRTAIQRMAAAIMAHHANMIANASKGTEIVSLSKVCHPAEAMARATLQKALVAFFLPGRVITATKTDAKKTEKRGAEQNYVKTIREGLEFASVLALCGVTLSSYDSEIGLWNVPASLCCSPGFSIEGDTTTLLLDGTAWVARKLVPGSKSEYESFMASVARVKEMRKPKQEREPASGQGGAGSNAQSGNKPAEGGVTIRSQIAQLMTSLRATDDKKPIHTSWSTFEEQDRVAIQAFRRWCDAMDKLSADAAPKRDTRAKVA